jgi:hypothetical protein
MNINSPPDLTMPSPTDSKYPEHVPQALALKEQAIEDAFIEKLRGLKYTVRTDIRDRAALERNFREKFEALNRVRLTDSEFQRLHDELITADVFTNARVLREKNDFTRDDGTPLAYTLVNIRDWCKNDFEVISQLRINTDYSHHRYDVILLINGVPIVQVELKTLSVNARRAMEQIVEYKNDLGNGYTRTLLCFIQLFIVSNRTDTIYFANNNARHFAFNADERFLPVYRFADRDNKPVNHLDDFSERFLQKCELGRMISRYMVLIQSEQKLLMMRPYQIYAVQAIIDCIDQSNGNGYIWHTTGSGKTLTSFKASTLLKENDKIDKCLFVVDRKDLGHIDTVIGLPPNLFYSTGIPVCILVLKKCKKPDDVLFINAVEHFEKGKRQNILRDEDIDKIVETYQQRPKLIERYARRVGMDEIKKEGYNLNISRYISTATAEAEIDLAATHAELVKIEDKIREATNQHNEFLKELGLPLLP